MSLKHADTVYVYTVLPPGATKPNAHDQCSIKALPSQRPLVEHVWGNAAHDDTPCVCGLVTLGFAKGADKPVLDLGQMPVNP